MMDLGDRMKRAEQSTRTNLIYRCPAILRIDGRAFHTFTRGFNKPWDWRFHWCMFETAKTLCSEISSAKFAYGQSDEISILLTDYDTLQTEQWFGGSVQKIVSVAASIATLAFNKAVNDMLKGLETRFGSYVTDDGLMWSKRFQATFDARVFSIPKEDVANYFVWRQQDAVRNSIQMLGRSVFYHSSLWNKNCDEIQEKLWQQHKINWNDCPTIQKRGWAAYRFDHVDADGIKEPFGKNLQFPGSFDSLIKKPKWAIDIDIPTFTKYRKFIETWLDPIDMPWYNREENLSQGENDE